VDQIEICNRLKQAVADKSPYRVVGGNSKHFLGRDLSHLPALETQNLAGIVHYAPAELVLQVQAGTRLREIEELLDAQGQMLAFEPPGFDGDATIGGVVSSAIAGSRRPYAGAVRDYVLGLNVVSGAGEALSFGGQVMKNVAGYDVSRLMTGTMGCLGVITEVSLKVLPRPEFEVTRAMEVTPQQALAKMTAMRHEPSLVSGSAYYQNRLFVRFSGAGKSVAYQETDFGGERVPSKFWQEIDNLRIFREATELWRISVTPSNPMFLDQACLIDWAGGQRWLVDPVTNPRLELREGHATLIKGESQKDPYQPLTGLVLDLHRGLKNQFDPAGVLNPGKMFSAF